MVRVIIVPGWAMYAGPYAPLAEALEQMGAHVLSLTLPGHGNRVAEPFTRMSAARTIRSAYTYLETIEPHRPVYVAAESAGVGFAISSLYDKQPDGWVLLAPGLLPRFRQLFSWMALSDSASLILRNRMPLLTWRLDSISTNPTFVAARRADGLTLRSVGRSYVRTVGGAAVRGFFRSSHLTGRARIWQGTEDRVLNPLGAKILLRRLGSNQKSLELVQAEHGLIWDTRTGPLVIAAVAEWVRSSVDQRSYG